MKAINNTNKNAGITLVEILVVVCILSIAVGLSSISISLIYSRDTERCAKEINAALENVRMNSMSMKGTFSLDIDRRNNQIIKNTPGERDVEQLADRVAITFESESVDFTGIETLRIVFDKSTGKVIGYQTADGRDFETEKIKLLRIRCANESGKKVATVVLVKNTGKHYVEYGS